MTGLGKRALAGKHLDWIDRATLEDYFFRRSRRMRSGNGLQEAALENVRRILVWILYCVSMLCAVILISQGGSFARWNKFGTVEDSINQHAGLLVIAGIGILTTAALALYVLARTMQVEKQARNPTKQDSARPLVLSATDRRYIHKMKILVNVSATLSVMRILFTGILAFRSAQHIGARLAIASDPRQVIAEGYGIGALVFISLSVALAFFVVGLFAFLFMQDRREHPSEE